MDYVAYRHIGYEIKWTTMGYRFAFIWASFPDSLQLTPLIKKAGKISPGGRLLERLLKNFDIFHPTMLFTILPVAAIQCSSISNAWWVQKLPW